MGILTFGGDDFTPTYEISGTVSADTYTTWSPELDGEFSVQGGLDILIPQKHLVTPLAGQFRAQGGLKAGVNSPSSAFKDFAHYPFAGTDPAMAMIGATNGGISSGTAGNYTRPWAIFTPPMSYPVSNGGRAWSRAAYASVGFKFANMPASNQQLMDAVQLEDAPLGAAGPSAYTTARTLQVVVKPTRLNYAQNPNFESGRSGYGTTGSSTLAMDTLCWQGTQSMKVTVPAGATSDSGSAFQVTGLIPGRQYVMSARVAIALGCGSIAPWSSVRQGVSVSYAQAANTMDPARPRWRTVSVAFTATASPIYLGMNVVATTMTPAVASLFWIDGILVEEGTSLRPYFDGSMGTDYLWETGGTANLARSYYYQNRIERGYLVTTLLNENTPLGITPSVPTYAVLPTQ
jgi:hypothetical protein